MPMQKISMEKVKAIAKKYGLTPCKVKGTEMVNIRKKKTQRQQDISWEEFENFLKKRKLAVYRHDNDWLKIMKDKK